jgi:ubiquinone/menaquinone biosynthesis C-methylase UbiE
VDEAYRILRPGGQLLVLELAEHDFEKARELYKPTSGSVSRRAPSSNS